MNYWQMIGGLVLVIEWIKKAFKLSGWTVRIMGLILGVGATFVYGNLVTQWEAWQCIAGGVVAGFFAGGAYDIFKEGFDWTKKLMVFIAELLKQKP